MPQWRVGSGRWAVVGGQWAVDIERWGGTFQLDSFASFGFKVRRRLPLLDTRVPCLARVYERRQVSMGQWNSIRFKLGHGTPWVALQRALR